MKKIGYIIIGLTLAIILFYMGMNVGKKRVTTNVVQNTDIIKEIAELAALEVQGTTNLKMTNAGDNAGFWNKFKNYFTENTLNLSIPYVAKYGVDMGEQKLITDTKKGTLTVYLPKVKLLSLQLKLDEVDAISKTGVLYSATIDEYVKAQKQLYEIANTTLVDHKNHIELAENHIQFILEKYYAPMGLTVHCIFTDKTIQLP